MSYLLSGMVTSHFWWRVWTRKERLSKSHHVGGLPVSSLPSPPCVSCPAPLPLLLGGALPARAIPCPQSGAERDRAPNTARLLCPSQEHSLPIVWRKLQVGSKLLLKPSVHPLALLVTIVRPQWPFVSDRISLFAGPTLPHTSHGDVCSGWEREIGGGWERTLAWESRDPKTSHPISETQFPPPVKGMLIPAMPHPYCSQW